MNIVKPLQEKFQVSLEKGQREFAVLAALLEQPEGLSHWLVDQAYVCAIRPLSFETVDDSPYMWEALVRWIRLCKVPRDIQLVFRSFLVGKIAVVDFQNHVTVGLPPPSVKRLERRRIQDKDAYR